jgi:hypothetical protein
LEVVGVRGWQFAGKVCLLQQSQYGGWLLGQPEDSKTWPPQDRSTSSPPSHKTLAFTITYPQELCNRLWPSQRESTLSLFYGQIFKFENMHVTRTAVGETFFHKYTIVGASSEDNFDLQIV